MLHHTARGLSTVRKAFFCLCLIGLIGIYASTGAKEPETAIPIERVTVPAHPSIHAWMLIEDGRAVSCLYSFISRMNHRLSEREVVEIIDTILAAALKYDLDPLFIASVIEAESSFNRRAVSRCGAEGLMQLTKPVQPWLGVDDPFDVRQNINGGCLFFSYLRDQFSRPDLMLAAYNAGPTRVARLGRVPEIVETQLYIKRITRHHRLLQNDMAGCSNVYLSMDRRVVEGSILAYCRAVSSEPRPVIAAGMKRSRKNSVSLGWENLLARLDGAASITEVNNELVSNPIPACGPIVDTPIIAKARETEAAFHQTPIGCWIAALHVSGRMYEAGGLTGLRTVGQMEVNIPSRRDLMAFVV